MSTSYHSYLILGVEIKEEDLFEFAGQVLQCKGYEKHRFTSDCKFKCCPECGQKLAPINVMKSKNDISKKYKDLHEMAGEEAKVGSLMIYNTGEGDKVNSFVLGREIMGCNSYEKNDDSLNALDVAVHAEEIDHELNKFDLPPRPINLYLVTHVSY